MQTKCTEALKKNFSILAGTSITNKGLEKILKEQSGILPTYAILAREPLVSLLRGPGILHSYTLVGSPVNTTV